MSRWWLEGERCFLVPWVGLICRLWCSLNRIAHYLAYYLFLVNANRRTVTEKVAVLYFSAVSQVALLKCFAIFPVFIEFQNSSEKNVKWIWTAGMAIRVGHNEMEFITIVCAINGRVTKMTHIFAVPGCSFCTEKWTLNHFHVISGGAFKTKMSSINEECLFSAQFLDRTLW